MFYTAPLGMYFKMLGLISLDFHSNVERSHDVMKDVH